MADINEVNLFPGNRTVEDLIVALGNFPKDARVIVDMSVDCHRAEVSSIYLNQEGIVLIFTE